MNWETREFKDWAGSLSIILSDFCDVLARWLLPGTRSCVRSGRADDVIPARLNGWDLAMTKVARCEPDAPRQVEWIGPGDHQSN